MNSTADEKVHGVDRLAAQDLMMVWPEERGWSQDIGALLVFDGGSLLDESGRLEMDTIRRHVGSRLHRLPRFRQLIYEPGFGRGWPLWVDARTIDLTEHVQEVRVDSPARESELLATCEALRRHRFSPQRPRWGMWFLTGLPDGRVAMFVKLHHAMADGMSGIAALAEFFDLEPAVTRDAPASWEPAPMPSDRDLVCDNMTRQARSLRRAAHGVTHPRETWRDMRRGWPAVREAFGRERAPRSSLTPGAIGWHRRYAFVHADLGSVKEVAHRNVATVNDVLLAAIGGGLRSLLAGRGEPVEGVVVRAFVPVSLHGARAKSTDGNLDGGMFVPLPLSAMDDGERLRLIASETRERKKKSRPPGAALFRNRPIQKAMLRLAPHQRVMNTYVANVPGPPVPLYFLGAPVLEVFPFVPLEGNVTLGVGALSYMGQFNLTVVADRDLCPDVDIFVDGVQKALAALSASPPSVRERERPSVATRRGPEGRRRSA